MVRQDVCFKATRFGQRVFLGGCMPSALAQDIKRFLYARDDTIPSTRSTSRDTKKNNSDSLVLATLRNHHFPSTRNITARYLTAHARCAIITRTISPQHDTGSLKSNPNAMHHFLLSMKSSIEESRRGSVSTPARRCRAAVDPSARVSLGGILLSPCGALVHHGPASTTLPSLAISLR